LLNDNKAIASKVLGNIAFWDADLNKLAGVTDYVAESLNTIERLQNK
jgi:hypothetical protein